mgnify:CR=1 FL=1
MRFCIHVKFFFNRLASKTDNMTKNFIDKELRHKSIEVLFKNKPYQIRKYNFCELIMFNN